LLFHSPREDEAMGRLSAALTLAMLAGCGGEGNGGLLFRTVTVTVVNQGAEDAYGRAEGWEGEDRHDFSLSPGASTSFKVDVSYRLKVHVWRSSDSLVLFDDFWEMDDLDKLDDKVTVVVTP
jgi:hypothetical protein